MNNEKDEEIQADFLCDICGAIACHVSIKQMGEHKYICHSGFDGTSEMIIQSDQYRSVCKTLKQKTFICFTNWILCLRLSCVLNVTSLIVTNTGISKTFLTMVFMIAATGPVPKGIEEWLMIEVVFLF